MKGPDYIFSLQSKTHAFWQPDSSGMVTMSSKPYFLKFSPDGWENISVKNVRNKDFWGIDRSITIPLSYVNDGALILKDIMYRKGIESGVYLSVCKQQLLIDVAPTGMLNVITGGNPFVAGTNTGTITGTPGSTVYVQLRGNGSIYTTGYIGTTLVSGISSTVYPILIPGIGSINYNIFSAGSGNQLTLVNSSGTTTACYGYWYKQIYRGEVDLSEFVHNGANVTCTTLEHGLAKYLKANKSTVYEIPMNVLQCVYVKMDGIKLHQTANYSMVDSVSYTAFRYIPSFQLISTDGDQYGVINLSSSQEDVPSTTGTYPNSEIYYVKTSDNWFFKNENTTNIDIVITGPLLIKSNQNGTSPLSGSLLKIKSNRDNGSGGTIEYPLFSQVPVVGTVYPFNINQTITVFPGEKLFMMGGTLSVNSTLYDFEFLPDSKLSIKYITRRPATYIRALRAQYVFEQLVNKFTENNYTAELSGYFETYKKIVWTCGNAIRGLSDAALKISLSDFFQFYDCFDAVSLSEANGTVTFGSKVNSIDLTNIIRLENVANLKISVAKEYLFNQLAIGYPPIKSEIGALNGNEEFNCGFLWSIGTTMAPAKIDKTSRTKASCYEIEKIRTVTLDKNTTDNTADNEAFVLAIEDTLRTDLYPNYYLLDRSLNATATGLIEPLTVFNIPLSPKRMLNRNLPFLSSSMYLANLILKYASSDKNNKLVCDGIIEKADVQLPPDNKFFLPILFDFDVPAPEDLLSMLNMHPLSIFQFDFEATTYYGILQAVETGTSAKSSQNYQLLSLANNSITDLINYYG